MRHPHHLLSSHLPGGGCLDSPCLTAAPWKLWSVLFCADSFRGHNGRRRGGEKPQEPAKPSHTVQRQNPPGADRKLLKGTPEVSQVTHPRGPQACVYSCLLLKGFAAQSCPTLGNPMDYSPPGSSVRGILQARILEWVVIPFSRSSWPRDQT